MTQWGGGSCFSCFLHLDGVSNIRLESYSHMSGLFSFPILDATLFTLGKLNILFVLALFQERVGLSVGAWLSYYQFGSLLNCHSGVECTQSLHIGEITLVVWCHLRPVIVTTKGQQKGIFWARVRLFQKSESHSGEDWQHFQSIIWIRPIHG